MEKGIETKFTGWSFIVAAILLFAGWILLPHHIGEYFVATDFAAIGEDLWYWIWMFRFHIFGWVTMGIAIFALASITAKKPARAVIIPGIGMIIVGTFVLALATAFYYSYGAWGVGKTAGKSPAEIQEFIDNLMFTNHYVTCLVRFGRIFSGAGLILLGAAFVKWKIVNTWLGGSTILLGFAAMMIILFIPDNFEIYKPLFYLKAIWLAVMGISILRYGVNLPAQKGSPSLNPA